MSQGSEKKLAQFMPPKLIQELDDWIAKYPPDQKQSAVMTALRLVQEEHNHLTVELMDAVADYLDMPPIAVYEVSKFYSMYEHQPVGKYQLNVCTNISCMLRGSSEIVKHLEGKLGIHLGQTTQDGQFTLRKVECLGACVGAPMMQVNKEYHEHLTPESVDAILKQCQ